MSIIFYVHPNEGNGAYSVGAFQNTFSNFFLFGTDTHDFTKYTALQYGYGYLVSDRISLGFNLRQVHSLDGTTAGDCSINS